MYVHVHAKYPMVSFFLLIGGIYSGLSGLYVVGDPVPHPNVADIFAQISFGESNGWRGTQLHVHVARMYVFYNLSCTCL